MELPILAFCDGWQHVFDSIEEAAAYMEPIDVENHEWEAFDAAGHVLGVSLHRRRTRGLSRLLGPSEEVVQITEASPPTVDRDRLRELLLVQVDRNSRAHGSSRLATDSTASLPLETLLHQVVSMRR